MLLTADESRANEYDALWQQFVLSTPELATEVEHIRKLRMRPAVAETLVMQERPIDYPRPTYRHHRGEYLQPKEEVTPAPPEILHPWPADLPKNRLGFAHWLMSPQDPLTARVVVNRQWAAFFGRGIVATVDDFGMQGSPPDHPELLDWLAVTFMTYGHWSLKQLHRRIVTSAAYRQSSVHRPDSVAVDPENRLLTFFMPRVRLEAEIVRDSHLASVADDVCLIRSMHTDQFNHAPAQIFMNTGFSQPGWPSLGSWLLYGLGSETRELPSFVVMSTGDGISGGTALWSSGFLPTVYTGVQFRSQGDPILDVSSPNGVSESLQHQTISLINQLNRHRLAQVADPEIATRIASFEMAAQLQISAPELMDLSSETEETLNLYGKIQHAGRSFA